MSEGLACAFSCSVERIPKFGTKKSLQSQFVHIYTVYYGRKKSADKGKGVLVWIS